MTTTTTAVPVRAVTDIEIGATYAGGQCRFRVWAPTADRVDLHIVAPEDRTLPMEAADDGYWILAPEGVLPGTRYFYRLDGGTDRPDPASRHQPEGVHGPSEVVDLGAFAWTDGAWHNPALREYIIYELHLGTFTPEGTCDAAILHLPTLVELGVTVVELMPVAQAPGGRNWGYDGVQLFATVAAYGGPAGLQRFVDAAHAAGLAVLLDVVYNHLGPEGNYLGEFGPYFTNRHHTPWGDSVNVDGPHSDEVRRFFFANAAQWQRDFHFDGLRLDAVHAIPDFSAYPFLAELSDETHARAEQSGKPFYLIAESDLNDARLLCPSTRGGHGLDGQWSDDFHHALHVLLTDEHNGYYADYRSVTHLAESYRRAYLWAGNYRPRRNRRHGNSPDGTGYAQHVVCIQNHDQIGNRAVGGRLAALVPFAATKLAAVAVLLAPETPLIFMGEEYAEDAPFQYFVSHGDPDLVEAVRKGRREEFAGFAWGADVPDPQSEETFRRSVLNHDLRIRDDHHAIMWRWYQTLIALRKSLAPLDTIPSPDLTVTPDDDARTLVMLRGTTGTRIGVTFNFNDHAAAVTLAGGTWHLALDAAAPEWGGAGSDLPQVASGVQAFSLPPWGVAIWREVGA